MGDLLFFLPECGSILCMRLLFCVDFLGSDFYSLFFYIRLCSVSFSFCAGKFTPLSLG
jgi:hypothetical protein